jgi:hypothetical protein
MTYFVSSTIVTAKIIMDNRIIIDTNDSGTFEEGS